MRPPVQRQQEEESFSLASRSPPTNIAHEKGLAESFVHEAAPKHEQSEHARTNSAIQDEFKHLQEKIRRLDNMLAGTAPINEPSVLKKQSSKQLN